uniref:Cytochrome p450 n=1 Tax=Croton stellatopilosus TaxID=431156 RepID=A0A3G2CJX5_9ROSI|nr:cytochrome p450 [Croton stellatopilosus]
MENLYHYLALLLLIFVLYRILFHRKQKLPPSPFALPVIGHLHLIQNQLPLALEALLSKYGPVLFLKFGYRSVLVVSSPSAVEECLAKNDIIFANRPPSMASDHFTYNYSSFVWAPYGDLWRILRRVTVVQVFSSKSVLKTAAIREEEVGRLLRRLFKVSVKGKQKVDLKFLSSLLTCNVAMRLTVGKLCVDEEVEGTELEKKLFQEFKGKFFPSITLNICDFIPILRKIGFKGIEKGMVKLQRIRDEYLQQCLDEIRLKNINSETSNEEEKSLTEILLSLQELEPEIYTNEVIKSIMIMIFIAGAETTAGTLEWAMSLLLNNPHVLHKLRAEIDEQVGHGHLLNDLDLVKLPYLRFVINETLRLYPAGPVLLPHFSFEACTVGGYEIPSGTMLLVNAWAMHRDPKIWEEPLEFKPERFEGDLGEQSELGFRFIPFGAGRRACPGAALGMRMVSLALGALVQCFEWENCGSEKVDMSVGFGISLSKSKPLVAICSPRPELIGLLSQL